MEKLFTGTKCVIISDRSRNDFGCPGYIQMVMSSPHGTRMTVRVYSSDDPDSFGREHYLAPEQIESISYETFHRLLDEIRSRQTPGQIFALSGADIDGDITKIRVKEYCNMDMAITNEIFYSSRVTPKKVIYNNDNRTTTVLWADGTNTIVRCADDDDFTEYNGFISALAKKIYGGTGAIKKVINNTKSYQSSKKKKKIVANNQNDLEKAANTIKNSNVGKTFKGFFDTLCDAAKKTPPIMEGVDDNGENG